jgi:hypothetical protein
LKAVPHVLGMLLHTWNKPVNSACPSRNLHRVCLLASALSASCFHLAPFPFTLGEFWTSYPTWTTEAHTRSTSFFTSRWSDTNLSYLPSNEASTAHQHLTLRLCSKCHLPQMQNTLGSHLLGASCVMSFTSVWC